MPDFSTNLTFQHLSPVSDEENPDGRQDAEDEVRPVELLVEHGGWEEVAKHHHEDHARDHVDQNLEIENICKISSRLKN